MPADRMLFVWQTGDSVTRAVLFADGAANTVFSIDRLYRSFNRSAKHTTGTEFDAETALTAQFLVESMNETGNPFKAPESVVNLCRTAHGLHYTTTHKQTQETCSGVKPCQNHFSSR